MRYLTTPVVVFIAAVTQGALAADLRVEVFAGDFASVNSFIFSNGKSLLVLDAQRTPGEARKLAERIHALHLPLDYLLISHGHTDHFTGMALLRQEFPGARIVVANEAIRLSNLKADPDYVKIQQLVIIKTSALNRSAYCMSHNVPLGKKIGLTEAQIAAAQGDTYMASPDLDERQKAAVRWAEAVTNMTARDDNEAFAEMKKHFSEKQIVELTVFCGMWNYSNRLCEALHVDLERPDKRIEFQK